MTWTVPKKSEVGCPHMMQQKNQTINSSAPLDSPEPVSKNNFGGREMILTKEQRAALDQGGLVPLTIDGVSCVMLRADLLDRLERTVIYDDGELVPEDLYPAVLRPGMPREGRR